MSTAQTYVQIYTKLGYLFYSVAAADGTVRASELEELKRLVKEKWLPLEGSRDEFGTDAAHYIGMSFDYASTNGMSSADAFARFKSAFPELREHFDPGLRKMTLDTASAIADAYARTNKSELTALAQIRLLFEA